MRPTTFVMAILACCCALAGCSRSLEAPRTPGVCWHLVKDDAGKPKFNRLADHQPDLEHCAAQLEIMRLRFRSLGMTQSAVTGAFQGQYLFIRPEGVFTAQTLNGYQYPFMVRT